MSAAAACRVASRRVVFVPPASRTRILPLWNYPVWNLLKRLDAEGKLTPVQKVLTAPTMPAEELYDLDNDPHEIHNLVSSDQPEHRVVLDRLRGVLERWIEETDDQGRFFEPDSVAAARGTTRPGSDPNSGMIPKARAK